MWSEVELPGIVVDNWADGFNKLFVSHMRRLVG